MLTITLLGTAATMPLPERALTAAVAECGGHSLCSVTAENAIPPPGIRRFCAGCSWCCAFWRCCGWGTAA